MQAPLVDSTALCGFEWTAGQTKQVVYIDHNNHVQEMHVAPEGQWQLTDLTQLTGAPLAEGTHIVGYDWAAGESKQVVYIDSRGHVIELHVGMGGNWQCTDVTNLTGAPLADRGNLGPSFAAFSWETGNSKQIVYQDTNEHIMEMHVTAGGQWQLTDLTMVAKLLSLILSVALWAMIGPQAEANRSSMLTPTTMYRNCMCKRTITGAVPT